ncbi:MAG: DUF4908 domain-containing protein [Parvularculaceae bacterium]
MRLAAAGFGCLAAAGLLAPEPGGLAPARAQVSPDDPFAALVGRRRERRRERAPEATVQHYALATDNRAFLFENLGASARIKFLCAENDPRLECRFEPAGTATEIYELTPTRGPRGDVIFKTARGEALLRIASYGGATVFWPGESVGRAASKSYGDEARLHVAFATPQIADKRARRATAAVSALAGAPIMFDVEDLATDETASASVLADAVVMAAKGVAAVANDPTGARVVAGRLEAVRFVPGEQPALSLNGKVLEVRYNPSRDLAGRPSSAAVELFLEETL